MANYCSKYINLVVFTIILDNAYLAYLNQFTLVIQAKPRSNEEQTQCKSQLG